MEEKILSEGEFRVRVNFNVSGSSVVDEIKRKSAELINLINEMPARGNNTREVGSFNRLRMLAMAEVEHACSDAVKAATV